MMRAFQLLCIGELVLPVILSLLAIKGIFMIAVLLFMAFCHAFWAQNNNYDEITFPQVIIGAFRLLLFADGDGIDSVLELGGKDGIDDVDGIGSIDGKSVITWNWVLFVVASIVFCICILNLFIAQHGHEFEKVQNRVKSHFFKMRAVDCRNHLFVSVSVGRRRKWVEDKWAFLTRKSYKVSAFETETPALKQHRGSFRTIGGIGVPVCVFGLWLVSLQREEGIFVCSLVLFMALFLGDHLCLVPPADCWINERKQGVGIGKDDSSHDAVSRSFGQKNATGNCRVNRYLWWSTVKGNIGDRSHVSSAFDFNSNLETRLTTLETDVTEVKHSMSKVTRNLEQVSEQVNDIYEILRQAAGRLNGR